MTIDVTDRFVVHAGDAFAFTDENGFDLDGAGAPVLINAGAISLKVDAGGAGVGVAVITADGARVWNRAGASLDLDDRDATSDDSLFVIGGAGVSIRNDGDMGAIGGPDPIGLFAGGGGLTFVNTGAFMLRASDYAVGGFVREDAHIINTGVIDVTAAAVDGLATGFTVIGYDLGLGRMNNAGLIHIVGGDSAAGINLYSVYNGYDLHNSGRIIAETTAAGGASRAIDLPGDSSAPVLIDNSGVIRADVAIAAGFCMGGATVRNSGKIFGDLDFSNADIRVFNTGVIHGDVSFGVGDSLYVGRQGLIHGSVLGGENADTLVGGHGADILYGDDAMEASDDGADLLKGGRGNDSLYGGGGADTLVGGAGADQLSGGSGADVFVYDHARESKGAQADLITDLDNTDVIDLSAIDADRTQAGDQAFVLVKAFDHHAGELTLKYDAATGVTWLRADTNGDGHADMRIAIAGDHADFTHFVL